MSQRLSDADILELADLNLAESAREMLRWHTGYFMQEADDLLLVASHDSFPVGYSNTAMPLGTAPPADPAALMESAGRFFDARGRGFTLWARAHLDAPLAKVAESCGLSVLADMPGMVLDAPVKDAALGRGIRVEEVTSPARLSDLGVVLPAAYSTMGLPEANSRALFAMPERIAHPHVIAVVGYLDDRPVSAAMALLSHGIAGVYWVGSCAEARGRGIGDACTRRVGNLAFERGARCVVLQASQQGEPIYLRMGYREVTRYAWYFRGAQTP
jgi:ribosomal protein S18 acetylase RimI-like enzyme